MAGEEDLVGLLLQHATEFHRARGRTVEVGPAERQIAEALAELVNSHPEGCWEDGTRVALHRARMAIEAASAIQFSAVDGSPRLTAKGLGGTIGT